MAAGLFFIIVLLVAVAVIIGFVVLIASSSPSRADRKLQRRIKELEHEIYEIREIAYKYRDTDTSLSLFITDHIEKFNQSSARELE